MSNIAFSIVVLFFILSFISAFLWTFFNISWWVPTNYLGDRDFFIALFHIIVLVITGIIITANVCE